MQCGTLCYSLPNCFVFNLEAGEGRRDCVLIEEIYSVVESKVYDYYIDFEGKFILLVLISYENLNVESDHSN